MKTQDLDQADPTFVEDLKRSHPSVCVAARWLASRSKCKVEIAPLRVRPTAKDREAYKDHGDITVDRGRGPERVEVKHVGFHFTARADFPYPAVIVCSVYRWDNADPKPAAFLILSDDLRTVAVVKGNSSPRWIKQKWIGSGREELNYRALLGDLTFYTVARHILDDTQPSLTPRYRRGTIASMKREAKKAGKKKATTKRPAAKPQTTKKDAAIKMMKRARGASLAEMMLATGWQKHTVRGFLSLLGSRDSLKIHSALTAKGERRYTVAK